MSVCVCVCASLADSLVPPPHRRADADGTIDTSTRLIDAYNWANTATPCVGSGNCNQWRSAFTVDGSSFYTCGRNLGTSTYYQDSGVRYVAGIGSSTSVQISSPVGTSESRMCLKWQGQLVCTIKETWSINGTSMSYTGACHSVPGRR